jgi:hypothetical protein
LESARIIPLQNSEVEKAWPRRADWRDKLDGEAASADIPGAARPVPFSEQPAITRLANLPGREGAPGEVPPTLRSVLDAEARRKRLHCDLLYAARQLGWRSIETIGLTGSQLFRCRECKKSVISCGVLTLEHHPRCHAGRVLSILDQLMELASVPEVETVEAGGQEPLEDLLLDEAGLLTGTDIRRARKHNDNVLEGFRRGVNCGVELANGGAQ